MSQHILLLSVDRRVMGNAVRVLVLFVGLFNNNNNNNNNTEIVNVKVQNVFHGRNNITCDRNCKYRTAATLYTLEGSFISGIFK